MKKNNGVVFAYGWFAALLLSFALPALGLLAAGPVPRAGAAAIKVFNGRDLSGWTPEPASIPESAKIWSVRNGTIQCLGTPRCYLRTAESYSNYRLRLQWRWLGKPGNSGVFLHGSGPDRVWPRCYEAQLQAGNAGELRVNGGAKFHQDSTPAEHSLPRLATSNERAPGEWNDYDITCLGDTITLIVNGVRQNHLEHAAMTSGWIALQSEGGLIEFRGLTLVRLHFPGIAVAQIPASETRAK